METSNYIFLTKNDSDEKIYFAISPERIETLNVADTYGEYGQRVGHDNAGDYHFENAVSDAQTDCKKAIKEKFGVDVCFDGLEIHSIDNIETYNFQNFEVDDEGAGEHNKFLQLILEIQEFVDQWRKENETMCTCKGFNYHDGHNWRTIAISFEFDHYEPNYQIISDDELTDDLNQAIENKEYHSKGFGREIYVSGPWEIVDSHFQGTWAAYEIIEKDLEEEM